MEHARARQLMSEGQTTAVLEDHLRVCEDCRLYADALDTVLHHAPALVPAAPPGLRDRILTGVVGTSVVGATSADGTTALADRVRRRWFTAGSVAAAAAAVVAAVVLVGQGGFQEEDPNQVLAAAVGRIRGADATSFAFDVRGSSQVRLPEIRFEGHVRGEGSVEVTPPAPPAAPEAPALPPLPSAPSFEAPSFEAPSLELPEFGGGGDLDVPFEAPTFDLPSPPAFDVPELGAPELELLEDLDFSRFCDRLSLPCFGDGNELLGPLPDAYVDGLHQLVPELPQQDREVLTSRLHLGLELQRLGVDLETEITASEQIGIGGLELRYAGTGRSDGEDASSYTLDWEVVEPATVSGELEVVTAGGRTYVRARGADRWLVTEGHAGFNLAADTAPHDLDELLDELLAPSSAAEALGADTIGGVEVDGYVVTDGNSRTVVWVGADDGLIRRVSFEHRSGTAQGAQFVATTVFDLREHGTAADVDVPDEAVPATDVPLVDLPPFWIDVGAA